MTVLTRIESVASLDSRMPVGLAAGANVRTPCGLRRVENLRPGDLIVTRNDGLQPVRMIWKQTICAAEVAADPSLAPVLIPTRAVGPMMPQSAICVGAAQAVLIPGYKIEGRADTDPCLMRARDYAEICDEVCVRDPEGDAVFYSLVFDHPYVFTANGLPVESFHPTERALGLLGEEVRAEFQHLVPHLLSGEGEAEEPFYPVWEPDEAKGSVEASDEAKVSVEA